MPHDVKQPDRRVVRGEPSGGDHTHPAVMVVESAPLETGERLAEGAGHQTGKAVGDGRVTVPVDDGADRSDHSGRPRGEPLAQGTVPGALEPLRRGDRALAHPRSSLRGESEDAVAGDTREE